MLLFRLSVYSFREIWSFHLLSKSRGCLERLVENEWNVSASSKCIEYLAWSANKLYSITEETLIKCILRYNYSELRQMGIKYFGLFEYEYVLMLYIFCISWVNSVKSYLT